MNACWLSTLDLSVSTLNCSAGGQYRGLAEAHRHAGGVRQRLAARLVAATVADQAQFLDDDLETPAEALERVRGRSAIRLVEEHEAAVHRDGRCLSALCRFLVLWGSKPRSSARKSMLRT